MTVFLEKNILNSKITDDIIKTIHRHITIILPIERGTLIPNNCEDEYILSINIKDTKIAGMAISKTKKLLLFFFIFI